MDIGSNQATSTAERYALADGGAAESAVPRASTDAGSARTGAGYPTKKTGLY